VLTYTLMAAVFADQLDVRTELGWTIWQGTVVTRYLQPIGMVGLYVAEALGKWAFAFVTFSVPLLLAAPLLGVDPRPASMVQGVLFLVSLGLGVTVGVALDFLFGALLVVLRENIWAIHSLRRAVGLLLSGALLPLQLYPWGIGDLFAWLPFAAMASAPLRIYTGTGDPLPLLLSQLAWAVVLWPLAQRLWGASREQMVAAGG
jgi:ABC-2 type transport system permease protein